MIASVLLASALVLTGQKPLPMPDGPIGPPADKFTPDPSWKPLDRTGSLFLDPTNRRLVIRAKVCVREGFLEHLLCADRTKEHESILSTRATPRAIHAGLLAIGADQGHPVRFLPRFEAPTGSPIAITVSWVDEHGKAQSIDARQLVRDATTKKPIEKDWVFAGSEQFPDPEDAKKIIYAADGGDLFTVANFTSAILDVPIESTANDAARSFEANTEKIPPRDSYVSLFLKPIRAAGKSIK